MKNLFSGLAGLVVCLAMVSASARAQDPAPQQNGQGQGQGRGEGRGQGGGMFMMAGNSAHGSVTAVSGNEITIKDEQGQTWKVETGANTRVMKDREPVKVSDIHAGDVVIAAGNLDDQAKTVGAAFVVVLNPEQAARMEKMRADFGKTWTAGRVTAIKDLTLTIERPDKVTQTVAVDENTTFHKRNEDITFPDIKVGDRVRATGSLQNGNFLATNLSVMEFGQRGQGRFAQQGGAPGAQPAPQQGVAPPAQPAATTPQPQNAPQP
ncbi:MAG TPA: DUF5666 domain-containing protein [Acidobacteriaceae bacterium]|nr:DUF5666 domain-containing protein [Acidobacteriaceae bacterium]